MLKIRLSQTGTKNKKKYRIIAIEEGKQRDGKAVEILGFYNPQVRPSELKVDKKRVDYWVSKGAQLTEGVTKVLEGVKTK